MLQKKEDAKGSVGEGVGLLIAFNILWLMFIWTYIKVSIHPFVEYIMKAVSLNPKILDFIHLTGMGS